MTRYELRTTDGRKLGTLALHDWSQHRGVETFDMDWLRQCVTERFQFPQRDYGSDEICLLNSTNDDVLNAVATLWPGHRGIVVVGDADAVPPRIVAVLYEVVS